MPKNSKRAETSKKPPEKLPLFKHKGSGQWSKKIKGRHFYFGTDLNEALADYYRKQKFLEQGIEPPRESVDVRRNVEWLVNKFLDHIEAKVETGERSWLSLRNYKKVSEEVVAIFGHNTPIEWLTPKDFAELRGKLAKGRSIKTLDRLVTEVRAIFNYGEKNLLFEKALRRLWGSEFDKPDRRAKDRYASTLSPKMLERDEILKLIEAAPQPLKAMILLAVNTGLGNTDLGALTFEDLDLAGGWMTKARQKTGVARRCPLWPETIASIEAWLKIRKAPKSAELRDLVFITRSGTFGPHQVGDKGHIFDPLSLRFNRLRRELGITARGKSFYALRHVVETIGGESGDQVAVDAIMGHKSQGMGAQYRERISDERLKAVSETIRKWLFVDERERIEGERAAKQK